MIKFAPKIGLTTVLFTTLFATTLNVAEAIPNLDGDSQPNRIKLSECIADVKEVTAWDADKTQKAAINLCDLRKAHVKEKSRFLADLEKLKEQYKGHTNHGFEQHLPTAVKDSWTIVKSCIEFKEGFTYPHNIGVLNVPESIRISCYAVGSNLVESQFFPPQ